jgi:hypothetical protein
MGARTAAELGSFYRSSWTGIKPPSLRWAELSRSRQSNSLLSYRKVSMLYFCDVLYLSEGRRVSAAPGMWAERRR